MTNARTTSNFVHNPGNRNVIINGSMDIWQRGTSFTNVTNGQYTADRWAYAKNSTGTINVTQSTDVPTVAQAEVLYVNSLLSTVGTAEASPAAANYFFIYQVVEGFNWKILAQRIITVSFWVKSSVSGTYGIRLANSGNDRNLVASYTINSANTWEYKTVTMAASPASGTWNYTNGTGVYLQFNLMSGSTGITPNLNSWQNSGTMYAPTGQVNLLATSGNTFRIVGIQLEAGRVATDYEMLPVATTYRQCLRYYANVTQPHYVGVISGTSNAFRVGGILSTPMRAAPTVASTASLGIYDGTATYTHTLTGFESTPNCIEIEGTISPATSTTGRAAVLYITGTASVVLTAEL